MESLKLELGTSAGDFDLPGTDGKSYSLKSFRDAKVLVVAFICNHCPYAQAVWPRLVELQSKFKDRGVQFVALNPNINNPDYPEETLEKMKEYAQKFGMNFPYLADDAQSVARKYKAQCTPDIYVFDSNRRLVYHGRVDDNWQQPEKVKKHELAEALDALVNGQKPSEDQHPSIGCSIKWK